MSGPVDRVVETVAAAAGEVRTGLADRRDRTGGVNPSGERVLAADAHADEVLLDRLGALDGVGEVASEERESPVDAGAGVSVAVDPLDGSSNVASNNLCGTVFGVYDAPLPAPGDALLAAGYVLYGPATTMTVARDGRVTESVVTDDGRRTLDDDVTLPDGPTVYGFGGRTTDWTDGFRAFAEEVRADETIKLRYGGSMVGDVNQVLAHGGLFAYPALRSAPAGKLRAQFEAIPVGAVVEAAGGATSDGDGSLLDLDPGVLHARTPVYVGSEGLVGDLEATLAEHGS
jgi:fructose-1,6-bisphosphatase I